jgi:tetratricopeptide (TPR) repeat protein
MSPGDRRLLPFRRRHAPRLSDVEEFSRFVRQLAYERAAASSGRIDDLLAATPVERWSELVEHPELRTYGALEFLSHIFAGMLPRDPRRALVLAQLGVSLAENLPANAYPASTFVQAKLYAWKDLGTVLRILSRNQESIDALLTAEAAILQYYDHGAGAGALTHDLAIIHFCLAVTYQEVARFTESRELLTNCKAVFREHGDDQRYVLCVFAEGVLLQRHRNYREAREIYLLVLATNKTIDTESRAALHHTIGLCCIELGDFAEADDNFAEAIALYQQVGKRIGIMTAELGRGRLLLRQGSHAAAIDHLRAVRRDFLRNSMPEEAGLAGLEIVEALLNLGRTSAAETLARKIVREFTVAHLSARAITALGYLSEAIAANDAPAALATEVREYIVSLRTTPERDFRVGTGATVSGPG